MKTNFWDVEVPTEEHTRRMKELLAHCRTFIDKQTISCAEATAEDRVYENAPDFIHGVCEIVGYHKDPDDEDED